MTYGALQSTNLPARLTVEHLETRAFTAAVRAKANLVELSALISGLSADEQEEVRQSMKSGLVAASGIKDDPGKVETWAAHNKIESQLAMAWEATRWSGAQIKCEDPKSRRQYFLKIAEAAHRVWKAHSSTTECLAELVARGSAKGSDLWVRLNNE